MSTQAKIEFTVETKCCGSEDRLKKSLDGCGQFEYNAKTGRLVIETQLPWSDILNKIESTGQRAVLSGFGGQAAVSIVGSHTPDPVGSITGVVRFTSQANGIVVDGVVDGLASNKAFHVQIHECGDLSRGCDSVGDIYGMRSLGRIDTDSNGRTSFRFNDEQFQIPEIIGRSAVIVDENRSQRLACGIIARAAGIDQNFKRICACDGITLWDERNVPLAGGKRSVYNKQ